MSSIVSLSENSKDKTSIHNRLSGFTLVELAIVVIIVGMIIVGVVGGQSLIKSSKLSEMISQLNEVKIAVNSFKLQYDDNLPGDIRNATDYWSGTANGDGDGKIEMNEGAHPDDENLLTFEHMSLAGLIKESFEATVAPFTKKSDARMAPLMRTAYDSEAGYMLYSVPNPSGTYVSYNAFYTSSWEEGLVIKAAKDRGNSDAYYDRGFISPADARNLDKKYDDGSIDSGWIRANSGAYWRNGGGSSTSVCVTNTSGSHWTKTSNEYDVSIKDPNCIMFFFIEQEVN